MSFSLSYSSFLSAHLSFQFLNFRPLLSSSPSCYLILILPIFTILFYYFLFFVPHLLPFILAPLSLHQSYWSSLCCPHFSSPLLTTFSRTLSLSRPWHTDAISQWTGAGGSRASASRLERLRTLRQELRWNEERQEGERIEELAWINAVAKFSFPLWGETAERVWRMGTKGEEGRLDGREAVYCSKEAKKDSRVQGERG